MRRSWHLGAVLILAAAVILSGCGGPPGPVVLFREDFESYPAGEWMGGGSWTVIGEADPWTIVQEGGTKILQSAYGCYGWLHAGDDGWTDYTVSARVRIDHDHGSFWLYGRFASIGQTMYEFRLHDYLDGSIDCSLGKWTFDGVGWTHHMLAVSYDYPFDDAFHGVKMVLAGGNIKCYIDEALIFDYNDTEDDVGLSGANGPPLLAGGIGFETGDGGYSLDDVLVTE